jgi:hypothetical protein
VQLDNVRQPGRTFSFFFAFTESPLARNDKDRFLVSAISVTVAAYDVILRRMLCSTPHSHQL